MACRGQGKSREWTWGKGTHPRLPTHICVLGAIRPGLEGMLGAAPGQPPEPPVPAHVVPSLCCVVSSLPPDSAPSRHTTVTLEPDRDLPCGWCRNGVGDGHPRREAAVAWGLPLLTPGRGLPGPLDGGSIHVSSATTLLGPG